MNALPDALTGRASRARLSAMNSRPLSERSSAGLAVAVEEATSSLMRSPAPIDAIDLAADRDRGVLVDDVEDPQRQPVDRAVGDEVIRPDRHSAPSAMQVPGRVGVAADGLLALALALRRDAVALQPPEPLDAFAVDREALRSAAAPRSGGSRSAGAPRRARSSAPRAAAQTPAAPPDSGWVERY